MNMISAQSQYEGLTKRLSGHKPQRLTYSLVSAWRRCHMQGYLEHEGLYDYRNPLNKNGQMRTPCGGSMIGRALHIYIESAITEAGIDEKAGLTAGREFYEQSFRYWASAESEIVENALEGIYRKVLPVLRELPTGAVMREPSIDYGEFSGQPDLIIDAGSHLYIYDLKTGEHPNMSKTQASLYYWALTSLYPGKNIHVGTIQVFTPKFIVYWDEKELARQLSGAKAAVTDCTPKAGEAKTEALKFYRDLRLMTDDLAGVEHERNKTACAYCALKDACAGGHSHVKPRRLRRRLMAGTETVFMVAGREARSHLLAMYPDAYVIEDAETTMTADGKIPAIDEERCLGRVVIYAGAPTAETVDVLERTGARMVIMLGNPRAMKRLNRVMVRPEDEDLAAAARCDVTVYGAKDANGHMGKIYMGDRELYYSASFACGHARCEYKAEDFEEMVSHVRGTQMQTMTYDEIK